jgi:hypothetical protein
MRIRILHRPSCSSIDGIRLDRFEPGQLYEVGNSLSAVFLAEGWAEPVALDEPAAPGRPPGPPVKPEPPSASQPYREPPSNLIREFHPADADRGRIAETADADSRKRRR